MSPVTVDASVVVKWFVPERGEADAERAMELLAGIRRGEVRAVQPPHWIAEVTAVLARLSPDTALRDAADLLDLGFGILDSPEVYLEACRIALDLQGHVFDTLYHAVALGTEGGILVTADERYHRRARGLGSIVLLSRWSP